MPNNDLNPKLTKLQSRFKNVGIIFHEIITPITGFSNNSLTGNFPECHVLMSFP